MPFMFEKLEVYQMSSTSSTRSHCGPRTFHGRISEGRNVRWSKIMSDHRENATT
jgi:hypothetical protein